MEKQNQPTIIPAKESTKLYPLKASRMKVERREHIEQSRTRTKFLIQI
jgi:hypothetical protein